MNSVNGHQGPTEQAGRRWPWLVAGLALCLPGSAWAQTEGSANADPLFSGIATLLVATVALVIIAWQRRLVRRESLRADHFAERSGLLEAALDSAPWPHFGWTAAGAPLIDPAFATAMGRTEVETMDDLLGALATNDAPALKAALGKLRTNGTPFDIDLRRADGTPVRLIGRRGHGLGAASNAAKDQVDLIWLVNPAPAGSKRTS